MGDKHRLHEVALQQFPRANARDNPTWSLRNGFWSVDYFPVTSSLG